MQLISFEVVALDPLFFSSLPEVTADGILEFETALNVNGRTAIKVCFFFSTLDP